jgi:hypothetical protein
VASGDGEKMARPRALPSWAEAAPRAAASPALSGETPAFAAVWTPTKDGTQSEAMIMSTSVV